MKRLTVLDETKLNNINYHFPSIKITNLIKSEYIEMLYSANFKIIKSNNNIYKNDTTEGYTIYFESIHDTRGFVEMPLAWKMLYNDITSDAYYDFISNLLEVNNLKFGFGITNTSDKIIIPNLIAMQSFCINGESDNISILSKGDITACDYVKPLNIDVYRKTLNLYIFPA